MPTSPSLASRPAGRDAAPYHIYFPFIGQNIGGSHISAFTLAEALIADFGVPCTVIARRGSAILEEAASKGLGVMEHDERAATAQNGRHNPLYDLRRLPGRISLLRGLPKGGILHTNDIGGLQSWMLPARFCGFPMVYHHRALNRRVRLNEIIIRSADHVIPISIETKANADFVPPARATTIVDPLSIDQSVDRERARQTLCRDFDIPADAQIVGFAGNLWRRKRPDFFLAVAAAMAERAPKAVFVIFGRDGDFTIQDMKDEAARLGIAERLRMAGFRTPVEDNLAAIDLLLYPSLREPFGRSPIEAALLGKPYVGTDDAGLSEIMSRWQGGRLVAKEASAAEFADVALAVLNDPASVVLTPERRQAVAEELSPREHARRAIEIYDRFRDRL
ncbi:MAG: hypothetical protein DI527_10485 [Chelatococcus sp.]|nr:MAG: hypothetical protein DI527_10485 [Chelatococcus sp.]